MEAEQLRAMGLEEIVQRSRELREEIFHLQLKRATNQLENPMKLRQARRDLARAETILREKQAARAGKP
jgi:large subunit ribosomal protein L29